MMQKTRRAVKSASRLASSFRKGRKVREGTLNMTLRPSRPLREFKIEIA
jgi:hypothetical protein